MDPKTAPWLPRIVAALRRVGYDAAPRHPEDLADVSVGEIGFTHHSVVVRPDVNWADGVGLSLLNARRGFKPVLLLVRPTTELRRAGDTAKMATTGNVPPIELWALDAEAATLDMGDGRVIPVA